MASIFPLRWVVCCVFADWITLLSSNIRPILFEFCDLQYVHSIQYGTTLHFTDYWQRPERQRLNRRPRSRAVIVDNSWTIKNANLWHMLNCNLFSITTNYSIARCRLNLVKKCDALSNNWPLMIGWITGSRGVQFELDNKESLTSLIAVIEWKIAVIECNCHYWMKRSWAFSLAFGGASSESEAFQARHEVPRERKRQFTYSITLTHAKESWEPTSAYISDCYVSK